MSGCHYNTFYTPGNYSAGDSKGLQSPLAGCGERSLGHYLPLRQDSIPQMASVCTPRPSPLILPPQAAQEQGDLNSYCSRFYRFNRLPV